MKDLIKQAIQESEEAIRGIKEMEKKEDEAVWTLIDLTKASNLIKYNDEIINRPKKEWF